MEKQLKERLISRLAELSHNDGGRLMKYLGDDARNREKQSRFVSAMVSKGFQKVSVWVAGHDLDQLRARYPGPRGGVDWAAVVAAALGKDAS